MGQQTFRRAGEKTTIQIAEPAVELRALRLDLADCLTVGALKRWHSVNITSALSAAQYQSYWKNSSWTIRPTHKTLALAV